MPPKRKSAPSQSGNATKSSKADGTGTANRRPRSRWSRVSASANADNEYKLFIRDTPTAYSYICCCRAPFAIIDDDDEEDEDEDEDAQEETEKKIPCDGGKTCICRKPAEEHPEHPWIMTNAGLRKFIVLQIHATLRDPDLFNLYTYNDHAGYGVMEVVQNVLLDFEEAKSNWKEQWAICEAIPTFFLSGAADRLNFVDDGDGVFALSGLVGTMFLTMLATLERHDLLKPDSEVKSLGTLMALYIRLTNEDFFEAKDFDARVFAYAAKHNIQLRGLSGIEDHVESLKASKVNLPDPGERNDDPWDWAKSWKAYVKGMAPEKPGGDSLDVTTWSSAERKKYHFANQDPLDKPTRDAIKEGLVLEIA